MLSRNFIKDYDPARLKRLLAVFFIALSVPTAIVIWQAYSQLKFEAFYQHRNQAESLSQRIDGGLIDDISRAQARGFADFQFLSVTGDTPSNIVQRSPLAAFPVAADVPGAIGYFQVGADGAFSTPLLPDDGSGPDDVGLTGAEYSVRVELAAQIQQILADNRLVQSRPGAAGGLVIPPGPAGAGSDAPATLEASKESVDRFSDEEVLFNVAPTEMDSTVDLQGALKSVAFEEADQAQEAGAEIYSQRVFDDLNQPLRRQAGADDEIELEEVLVEDQDAARENSLGKLRDLKLDDAFERKSEDIDRRLYEAEPALAQDRGDGDARARRTEQIALPSSSPPEPAEARASSTGEAQPGRISAFESEIDPYEFSLLDSGHLVLFRNVWRDGERYIQGILIDQPAFLSDSVENAFRATTLTDMSSLIVGYQDDVIRVIDGARHRYPAATGELEGTLLYRTRLSAPFERLELVYSITRLPPGPAATVLAWSTVVITLVFLAGFYSLYRLGLGQIRLARQQQDFVSAVSHELKTPLTSIRMYGEMLKEGWADDEKRGQYYDYIHDESERLTRLISNVLQLAKITRNEPQFDLRPMRVGTLIDQVRSKIAHQVERAGFHLEFVHDDVVDAATINVDDDCFAQIIINLVDNALKFSKDAAVKTIDIGASTGNDGRVSIVVRDYGPGVPRDQLKKIFELFYRTESELTRETVGTGIGLAIVHQLTLAMDGSVDVINREPGVEFRLTFPAT